MDVKKDLAFPGGQRFLTVINDLLYEPVDCIVNAANGGLSHGGGVAAAIAEAAGPELDNACRAIIASRGRIPVGDAVVTVAGGLPFKGIIHAVGPRFGDGDEENKLARTLMAAFLRAHEQCWASLSFPGISSGLFAVPNTICARVYHRAVRDFFAHYPVSTLRVIRLCLYEGPLADAVKQELDGATP